MGTSGMASISVSTRGEGGLITRLRSGYGFKGGQSGGTHIRNG